MDQMATAFSTVYGENSFLAFLPFMEELKGVPEDLEKF